MDEREELKKLAAFVEAGFKDVGEQLKEVREQLTLIEKEHEYMRGFEIKEKVSRNADAIGHLNEWKIEVDPMLRNLRRAVWGLLAAVGGAFLTGLVAVLVYWITHIGK